MEGIRNTAKEDLNIFNWKIKRSDQFKNTLQVFITNRCNIRCVGCFVDEGIGLGSSDMTFEEYVKILDNEGDRIQKVVLLGGEPTIHPDLIRFCEENEKRGLITTIYTNGLIDVNVPEYVNVRVSVSGATIGPKPLSKSVIKKNSPKFSVRLGIEQCNKHEISLFAELVEKIYGVGTPILFCRHKRIDQTGSYDVDTNQCVSGLEYISLIEEFLGSYDGGLKEVHVTKQGYIHKGKVCTNHCRFGNVFKDNTRVTCPLDLGLLGKPQYDVQTDKPEYGRPCDKNNECLLQKIVLVR
jgi:organic radical activating enzyme